MHDPHREVPWATRRATAPLATNPLATTPGSLGGKAEHYSQLAQELDALLTGEPDFIACAANAVAAIFHTLPDLNWAGFYFLSDRTLVLGPFQGLPACTRIALGAGVCGAAALRRHSVLAPDVAAFPGHIACDTASRSELVVPLISQERVLGVLDLDSSSLGKFDAQDQAGCEALAAVIVSHLRNAAFNAPQI